MTDLRAAQREANALVLRTVDGQGFVLAGSGAIREHGLVDRYDRELFRTAVEDAVGVLSGHGYRRRDPGLRPVDGRRSPASRR